jgi:hypothetical protein
MVVHQPDRLHERIADGRSYEPEPSRPERATQHARRLVFCGHLPPRAPCVESRPIVHEPPQEGAERAGLALDVQEGPCVRHGGLDLRAIAHDAGIGQQLSDASPGERGNLARIEALEGATVGATLAEDRRPAQPGLRALEREQLEEAAIVVDGHAPLRVVVPDIERRTGPGAPRWVRPRRAMRASTDGVATQADTRRPRAIAEAIASAS